MEFILPVILISILFPIVLVAQYKHSPLDTSQSPGIDRLNTITLMLLNPPAIGYRRCINSQLTWSISADLKGSIENESNRSENTDTTFRYWSRNSNSFTVSVYPQCELWFAANEDLVQPHMGFGPLFTYSHNTTIHKSEDRERVYYTASGSDVTNDWSIGFRLSFGIDVRIVSSLSLVTRYDLSWASGVFSSTTNLSNGGGGTWGHKESRLWLGPIQAGFAIHF
jgi:hypothetical protein